MPSISPDARLFGIDLHGLWQETRHAWARLQDGPLLSWLTPQPQVILLRVDGSQTLWRANTAHARPAGSVKSSFTAVELPEDLVLRRTLALPRLGDGDMENAVALQAKAASPFAPEDLAWGYSARGAANGSVQVELVLASRAQISQYVASQAERLRAIADHEIWVIGAGGGPIVVRGYGEKARTLHARRYRKVGYALLALCAGLLLAMAVTPTLQLRLRALQAIEAHSALAGRVAPTVSQREELLQSVEKLTALSQALSERVEPLSVVDMLTRVLPDDTAIQGLRLQGRKVTITGVTSNASMLMQLLGDQPGLRDVKAPSPAMRLGASTKESFVIEFVLEQGAFGVVVPGAPVGATAPAAANASGVAPASGAVTPPAPTGAPPAAPTANAPAPGGAQMAPPSVSPTGTAAPPAANRPTFGGAAPAAPSAPATPTRRDPT